MINNNLYGISAYAAGGISSNYPITPQKFCMGYSINAKLSIATSSTAETILYKIAGMPTINVGSKIVRLGYDLAPNNIITKSIQAVGANDLHVNPRGLFDTVYNVTYEQGGPGFKPGDLLLATRQDYDGNGTLVELYDIRAEVIHNVEEGTDEIRLLDGGKWSDFESNVDGIEFIRVGNKYDTDRQGMVVIEGVNGQYIDVLDGIDSFTKFDNPVPMARFGELDGLQGKIPSFPNIHGYGLYGQNVYLEGEIKITGGATRTELDGIQSDIVSHNSSILSMSNAISNINSTIDNLGQLAYEDLVEWAKLGSTIVQGGYIKTDLLDTQSIIVKAKTNGDLGDLSSLDAVGLAQLDSTVIVGGYIKTDLLNTQSIIVKAKTDGDLGDLSSLDMVGLAQLDTTVIVGGYLKTSLIDVNDLFTNNATISSTLTMGVGSIIKSANAPTNGYEITESGIKGYSNGVLNFNIPTDGSAPIFKSGAISETVIEASSYKSSADALNGTVQGFIVDITGFYIGSAGQTIATANNKLLADGTFQLGGANGIIYDGTNVTFGSDVIINATVRAEDIISGSFTGKTFTGGEFVGGLIKSKDTGARTEITTLGIRFYDVAEKGFSFSMEGVNPIDLHVLEFNPIGTIADTDILAFNMYNGGIILSAQLQGGNSIEINGFQSFKIENKEYATVFNYNNTEIPFDNIARIYTGTSNPSTSLGRVGDFYLKIDTDTILYIKTTSNWWEKIQFYG